MKGLVERAVGRLDAKVAAEHQQGFANRGNDTLSVVESVLNRMFLRASLGDVAEYEYSTGNLALVTTNGSCAVVDGALGSIFGDEQRVVGQPDNQPLFERPQGGVHDSGSRLLVDDLEDNLEVMAHRLLLRPPREVLGHGIHEGDLAVGIGRDDSVPDTGQGDAQQLRIAEGASLSLKGRSDNFGMTLLEIAGVLVRGHGCLASQFAGGWIGKANRLQLSPPARRAERSGRGLLPPVGPEGCTSAAGAGLGQAGKSLKSSNVHATVGPFRVQLARARRPAIGYLDFSAELTPLMQASCRA